jgi:CRP-like cAMP-binding protein
MDGYSVRPVTTGEVVFREGEPAEAAYLLLSGRVALSRETEHGTIPLAEFGDRQVFGEVAVIEACQRDATAYMLDGGEIVPIPPEQLAAQLEQSPPLIRTIVRSLVGQLVRAQQRLQPEQDRSLYLAAAHLLYQMNIALSADATTSLPYARAMTTLTTVLGRSVPEIEAVLSIFTDLNLIGFDMRGRQQPHLKFLVQEGFLGKALRHYDLMGGETGPDGETPDARTESQEAQS